MVTVYLLGNAKKYENYRRAVEAAGGRVRFGGSPAGCGALLLPGGGDLAPWRYGQADRGSRGIEPERDAAELMLLDRFLSAGKPVLGVCRGLQVINVYFGGTLVQDLPGHSAVNGRDRVHRIYTAASPLREVCGEQCIVNSAHHQAAGRLGAGLQAVQWAPDGTVEALIHEQRPVWGVQWHPERMDRAFGEDFFRHFLRLCR